jgi:hypothetical protein
LNQTPRFTEEWFKLKEEEIALCSSLAWCNESGSNIPIQNNSRSADADAHNNSSKKSEASSSTDVIFGDEGCNPPLKNSNTNAACNELASDPSCPESLPTLNEIPTDDSPHVPISQSIEITKHETLRKDGMHPKMMFLVPPCLIKNVVFFHMTVHLPQQAPMTTNLWTERTRILLCPLKFAQFKKIKHPFQQFAAPMLKQSFIILSLQAVARRLEWNPKMYGAPSKSQHTRPFSFELLS